MMGDHRQTAQGWRMATGWPVGGLAMGGYWQAADGKTVR